MTKQEATTKIEQAMAKIRASEIEQGDVCPIEGIEASIEIDGDEACLVVHEAPESGNIGRDRTVYRERLGVFNARRAAEALPA